MGIACRRGLRSLSPWSCCTLPPSPHTLKPLMLTQAPQRLIRRLFGIKHPQLHPHPLRKIRPHRRLRRGNRAQKRTLHPRSRRWLKQRREMGAQPPNLLKPPQNPRHPCGRFWWLSSDDAADDGVYSVEWGRTEDAGVWSYRRLCSSRDARIRSRKCGRGRACESTAVSGAV